MEPSASASSCEDAAASSETDNEEKVIRERLRVIEMRKLEREKKKDAETRKKGRRERIPERSHCGDDQSR